MSMIGNFVSITPQQLEAMLREPESVVPYLYDENDQPSGHLDVDKAWHGIHFLLTGNAWDGEPPLALAVLGGIEIGEDAGYGPARYLTPQQVSEVAAALASLSRETLANRFSADRFNAEEIYPGIWDEGDPALDYLLEYFDELATFYRQAASSGQAVLKYIN